MLLRAESRTDKDIPTDSNIPPGEDEANDNMVWNYYYILLLWFPFRANKSFAFFFIYCVTL